MAAITMIDAETAVSPGQQACLNLAGALQDFCVELLNAGQITPNAALSALMSSMVNLDQALRRTMADLIESGATEAPGPRC